MCIFQKCGRWWRFYSHSLIIRSLSRVGFIKENLLSTVTPRAYDKESSPLVSDCDYLSNLKGQAGT